MNHVSLGWDFCCLYSIHSDPISFFLFPSGIPQTFLVQGLEFLKMCYSTVIISFCMCMYVCMSVCGHDQSEWSDKHVIEGWLLRITHHIPDQASTLPTLSETRVRC